MFHIDIADFKEFAPEMKYIEIETIHNARKRIRFASQPTGYGSKIFWECPACKERRSRLYEYKEMFICRSCLQKVGIRVYKGIQDVTDGGKDYIEHILCKYAEKHDIKHIYKDRSMPWGETYQILEFNWMGYTYDKPKGMHRKTWEKYNTIILALFNMRMQCIMFNKRFSIAAIRSILNYTNVFLFFYDNNVLENGVIYWERGIDYKGHNYLDGVMTKDEMKGYLNGLCKH